MGTSSANSTESRARSAGDDTRPGPTGPIQPAPQRMSAAERGPAADERRSDRLRELREQILSGGYQPPLDDVAECAHYALVAFSD